MSEPLRFYMDQHFPGPVSQALTRRGVDVLTAQEADRPITSPKDYPSGSTSGTARRWSARSPRLRSFRR